jgi:hypothetical protein
MPRRIGQIVVDGRELIVRAFEPREAGGPRTTAFKNPARQGENPAILELIDARQRIEIVLLLAQRHIQASQRHTDDQLYAPLAAAPWDGLMN